MIEKRNRTLISYLLMMCWVATALLFYVGCAPVDGESRSIELYVDAVVLAEQDKNHEAIKKLNTSVELNNRFSLGYSLLGEIYQKIQSYEQSAASYEKAAELNPWSFKDFFNLGRVYQIMEKFANAVRAYARACELKPDHYEAHINAAQSYYELKQYNEALAYGQRAEQIKPEAVEIQKLLGDIYKSHKDHNEAISSYKRALEIDSDDTEVMTSLAVVYLRSGRSNNAKELLNSVIGIEPYNNTAYRHLGYCELLNYFQASEKYEDEKKVNDGSAEVLASLKEQMDELVNKSAENYTRAIEIDDQDWEAQKGLGVVYAIIGTNNNDDDAKQQAVEQWRLSLSIKPNQSNRARLIKWIEMYSK